MSCIKKKIKGGPDIPALYTKPPSNAFKFSEKHDVYIKDLRQIPETLPWPRPPSRSKSEIIDIDEYLLVDDKAIRVPMTVLSKPLDALVDYLIQDYDDDMSKVRVLFRWLTNQPIHRMQVLQNQPKNQASALHHLWLLRTKRQRYSKAFSLLCRYAGLYCVIIHGAVKGVHYQIGDRVDMSKHYGEWNAVCIDGEWRLIDALWGACDAKDTGDGRGRFKVDERCFLTDPKDLIYTHFAESPRWQLLDSPRHIESFEETAYLKNRFFELGMQVLSHPLCEIQAEDGEVDIIFGLQSKQGPEQKFNCYISHFDRPDTKRYLTQGSNSSVPIFIHRLTDSSISIKVRFAESGVYRLEIVGKQLNQASVFKDFDWVAVYKVLVENAADRGFPKMDPIGWGPCKEMSKIGLAPFNYTSGLIVAKSVQTKVRFKILDTNIVQNMKFFFKMASTYDNDYSVNTVSDRFDVDLNVMTFFIDAPPFGEYTLKMYARNVRGNVPLDQRRERNICNYLLVSDMPQRESPLGILTEKTEIADDPPEGLTNLPKGLGSPRKNEAAESIVSASNVVMDSKSHATESIPNSPEVVIAEQPKLPPTPPPLILKLPPSPAPAPSPPPPSPKSPPRAYSPEKVIVRSPVKSPPPEQSFVNVDGNLREIPEIPLNVVQPIKAHIPQANRSSEKREMKAVSSNKVVPLKGNGGNDDSIMLIPVEDKPKRPGTGVQKRRTRDDTKFFTALAHVRGDKR